MQKKYKNNPKTVLITVIAVEAVVFVPAIILAAVYSPAVMAGIAVVAVASGTINRK